jgi:hypothetical protein
VRANASRLRQQLVSHYKFIVGLLLLAIVVQCVLSIRVKTVTFDEPVYIVAGYSYLKTGDFSLSWQHPPLINVISATPLVFLDLKIQRYDPHQSGRSFVHDFLYVTNNHADQIVFWARLPIVFLSLLLGFTVFRWARELYGIEAGLLSLLLYTFSPNILAHSRLATIDLGSACFIFLACYRLWKFGSSPSVKNLFLAGLTLGLALLSKFTAFSILPIYLLFPFTQMFLKEPAGAKSADISSKAHLRTGFFRRGGLWMAYSGLIVGISLLIIAAAYPSFLKPWYRFDETILPAIQRWYPNTEINKGLWNLVYSARVPGREYALAVLGQLEHSEKGHDAFLWGKISHQGWWYYYLVTLAIKTPIALQLLLLLAIYTSFHTIEPFSQIHGKRTRLYDHFFLVIPPLLLLLAISAVSVQLGVRYALPVLPFALVFVGQLAQAIKLERRLFSGIAFLSVVWYVISSISIHPHYLAYFNEYVGGPANGYKYLLDSNLDWGQDLKGLKEYMEARGIEKVKLAYMGTIDLEYYGLSSEPISDQDLAALKEGKFTRDVFAISASFLQGLYLPGDRDRYEWFRDRTPTTQIGYSIFVYEIDCREERMAEGTAHFTPPTVRHPLEANLGDRVKFLGYDLDALPARPGDTLHLILYWQALAEMDESYTVFTHLLDKDNLIRGQKDSLPVGGTLPTSCWVKDEIIVDEYKIPIQPDAPPGQYVIEIGMYQLETGQRLPVIGQEGQIIGGRILLEEITIR